MFSTNSTPQLRLSDNSPYTNIFCNTSGNITISPSPISYNIYNNIINVDLENKTWTYKDRYNGIIYTREQVYNFSNDEIEKIINELRFISNVDNYGIIHELYNVILTKNIKQLLTIQKNIEQKINYLTEIKNNHTNSNSNSNSNSNNPKRNNEFLDEREDFKRRKLS